MGFIPDKIDEKERGVNPFFFASPLKKKAVRAVVLIRPIW